MSSTLTQVLNGHRDTFSDRTFSRLSKALGWEPHIARAIWDGEMNDPPERKRFVISAADGVDLSALSLDELLNLNDAMQAALRRKIEEGSGR